MAAGGGTDRGLVMLGGSAGQRGRLPLVALAGLAGLAVLSADRARGRRPRWRKATG